MLGRWIKEHQADDGQAFRGNGKMPPKLEELKKLRAQVKRLQMEKDILKTTISTELALYDNGIGIFKKIQAELGLLDERHAILELAKGKLTTDPDNHTNDENLGADLAMTAVLHTHSRRLDFHPHVHIVQGCRGAAKHMDVRERRTSCPGVVSIKSGGSGRNFGASICLMSLLYSPA